MKSLCISLSVFIPHFLLRYRVDRCKAPDLHWYHHEFVVECGEHAPGPDGLPDPRLETLDTGGDDALHRCHRLLVVRWMLGAVYILHIVCQCLCFSFHLCLCSGGCQSRLAGCWPKADWRRPRSIWLSVLRWTGKMKKHPNWTLRYSWLSEVCQLMRSVQIQWQWLYHTWKIMKWTLNLQYNLEYK